MTEPNTRETNSENLRLSQESYSKYPVYLAYGKEQNQQLKIEESISCCCIELFKRCLGKDEYFR